MKRLMLACAIAVGGTSAVWAQTLPGGTISVAGSDCSVAARCVDVDMTQIPSIGIYLNVGTSGTFVFEASVDATSASTGTWFAVNDDVAGAANATADGALFFTNPGYRRLRLRASAINGNATVTIYRGYAPLRTTATLSGGGDATAANQTTMITHLSAIETAVEGTLTVTATNLDVQIGGSDTVTVTATNLDVQSGGADLVTTTQGSAIQTAVELIDNAVYVDGAGWIDNTSSHMLVGGLYQSTPQTITDGDVGPFQVTENGYLITSLAGAGLTALQLIDNLIYVDGANFMDGTSSGGLLFAVAESAAPTTVTEGDVGALAMTPNRGLKVTLYNSSGIELTSTEVTEDAGETAGVTGPMVLNVRRDVAAASAGTTGDNATFNSDALGLLWTRMLDPCSGVAKTYIPIDITTATTTELTPSLAGASTYYHVCAFHVVTTAANNVALVDDDTDGCGSVTASLAGGLTAGEGWNLAANGGMTFGNGTGTVMRAQTANSVLCLVTSAATQLSGQIVVAAAP